MASKDQGLWCRGFELNSPAWPAMGQPFIRSFDMAAAVAWRVPAFPTKLRLPIQSVSLRRKIMRTALQSILLASNAISH